MTRKPKGPFCSRCTDELKGARLVIDGCWTCPTCAYELEVGPATTCPPAPRVLPMQEQRLFPIEPYVRAAWKR